MNNTTSPRIKLSFADTVTKTVCTVICFVFFVVFALPVSYVLISSVRTVGGWSLDGYTLLLQNKSVLTGLKNSILLAVFGTAYSLCLEIPAAYVLSKKKYNWLTSIFFLLGQFSAALLPLYLLLKQMNLLNSLWGLILPSGLSIYYTQLLRARMINLSTEIEDAASLDGCGPIRYLTRICIPTLKPTVGCIAFFHICSYWSNTLLARTLLTDESVYPLSLVLNEILIKNRASDILIASNSANSIAAMQMAEFALCVISAIPLVAVFLTMKKHINALETEGSLVM